MIQVYRTETGQFVLVHAASRTVIIDEDLAQGFEKMENLAKNSSSGDPHVEIGSSPAKSAGLQTPLLILLCLLPFLWLGILHYSLASLVDGYLSHRVEQAAIPGDKNRDYGREIEETRVEIGRIGREVSTLTAEVNRLKPKTAATPTPAAPAAPTPGDPAQKPKP